MSHRLFTDPKRGYLGDNCHAMRDFYGDFGELFNELVNARGIARDDPRILRYPLAFMVVLTFPFVWIGPVGMVHIEYLMMAMEWVFRQREECKKWWAKTVVQWYLIRYLDAGFFEGRVTTEPVELAVGGEIIVPYRPKAEEFWAVQNLPREIKMLVADF